MAQELVYTSAAKGLKPGTKGFCTVAGSDGIAPGILRILEMLNSYRHLGAPNSPDNPSNCAHYIVFESGRYWHLISKVSDAGLDYSGRGNMLAQHFVLSTEEIETLANGNPADFYAKSNIFLRNWEGKPRKLSEHPLSLPFSGVYPCNLWKSVTGDAGWAGVLAAAAEFRRSLCLICSKDLPVLSLFQEALAILPSRLRWNTSFATFYTVCPPNVNCLWKAVIKGEPEEKLFQGNSGTICIDLTSELPELPNDPAAEKYITIARSGKIPADFFDDSRNSVKNISKQDPENIFFAKPDSGSSRVDTVFSKNLSENSFSKSLSNKLSQRSFKPVDDKCSTNLNMHDSSKENSQTDQNFLDNKDLSASGNRFSAGQNTSSVDIDSLFSDITSSLLKSKEASSDSKNPCFEKVNDSLINGKALADRKSASANDKRQNLSLGRLKENIDLSEMNSGHEVSFDKLRQITKSGSIKMCESSFRLPKNYQEDKLTRGSKSLMTLFILLIAASVVLAIFILFSVSSQKNRETKTKNAEPAVSFESIQKKSLE